MKMTSESIIMIGTIIIITTIFVGIPVVGTLFKNKEVESLLSGKDCKLTEVNLYNGLESHTCDDGVVYTFKKM